MVRIVIGSIAAGIVQWLVGFIFWGTPLGRLAFSVAGDAQNADIQGAMARNLSGLGAGTYLVPWPETAEGAVMMGRGPVALVFFNPAGFPLMDGASLIGGLVLSIVTMLIVAMGLAVVAARVPDFASRFRVLAALTAAMTLYFIIGQPVYNFYMPWGYWIYLAISCVVGMLAGGFVLLRWFMPAPAASSGIDQR